MTGHKRIIFVDTNAFIQLRDLKDIDWQAIFPKIKELDLMIAPRVIEELDKHKVSTNQRRRDRARLALSLIEKASQTENLSLILKTTPVKVQLSISTAPTLDWSSHPSLDASKPDDQLIAEALSFGNNAEVFSHDTGPRIRARVARIQAHEPLPEWHLPPEQTDDQRKIARLEREVAAAISTAPNIIAAFDSDTDDISSLIIRRIILPPLAENKIDTLARSYIGHHKRAQLQIANSPVLLSLGGISQRVVDEYNSKYNEFIDIVYQYFRNLYNTIWNIGAVGGLSYRVENVGSVVAKGLRIEFFLDGSGSLIAEREDVTQAVGNLKPPCPPNEPASYFDPFSSDIIKSALRANINEPRDPLGFYWFKRPRVGSRHSAMQCEEFRPTRTFHDSIYLFEELGMPLSAKIRLHVSASNMRQPVELIRDVSIVGCEADWDTPEVLAILPFPLK